MDVEVGNKRDMWLVKVPKYLASQWLNAPARSELGKLQLPKSGQGPVKFISDHKLQESTSQETRVPAEHRLTFTRLKDQRIVILAQKKDNPTSSSAGTSSSNQSNSSAPDKISFEGDVKLRGTLAPSADLSYMAMKATSFKNAAKPVRTAQILDKAVTAYKPRGAAQLAHEADLRKKKEEAKKFIREDKEIVQGRLFKAFEKRQYYNIKELADLTRQPLSYLKEILKEICNYCSKSAHKNMWELKPEYRHYKNA